MDVIFRGESDAVDRVLILSITAVRMSVTQRCQLYTFSYAYYNNYNEDDN